MGISFDQKIPDEVLSRLKSGDLVCVQNFDWFVSWLIMYLTHSSMSHIAAYLGNRTIVHMTFDGVTKEPVDSLYGPTVRILPFINLIPTEVREGLEPTTDSMKTEFYYDKIFVAGKALKIISGRDWSLYRLAFFIDISLTLFLLDIIILQFTRFPLFSLMVPAYSLLLIINRIRHWKNPVYVQYPERLISFLFRSGRGIPLMDTRAPQSESEKDKFGNGNEQT